MQPLSPASDAAVVSGEGVALELPRAGVGSRVVASLIDLAVQVIAGLVLLLLTGNALSGADSASVIATLVVEAVLVVAGYPILFEWLSRGRTLGKLALGLRVVRDDGGPIGFRQALVRGLSSLVVEKPGLIFPWGTAAGLLTTIFSGRDKRIGDLLAGTFVLNERAGQRRRPPVAGPVGPVGSPGPLVPPVPPPLQPWAAALDLSRLDDRLALAVRQFLARAWQLTPAAQHELGELLRGRIEAVVTPPPPPGTPTPFLLAAVISERSRRATAPAAVPGGPWPAVTSVPPAYPAPPAAPPPSGGFAPPA